MRLRKCLDGTLQKALLGGESSVDECRMMNYASCCVEQDMGVASCMSLSPECNDALRVCDDAKKVVTVAK